MRFKKLDLNLLVALDALLNDASVSRAAQRLHMSQSAMSSALARLRDYFDDPLLIKMGRGLELTSRAEALRDPVRELLMKVDTTVATQPAFLPHTSAREFRLMASDYTLCTLAPYLTALAHEQSQTLRFRWLPLIEKAHRILERGEADMVIRPHPYCSDEHPIERLWDDRFVCVVCDRSQHAQRPLTSRRYLEAGHVAMQPNDSILTFDSEFLMQAGTARRIEVTSYSFMSMANLVLNTQRIATMHERLAVIAKRNLRVSLVAPPIKLPMMEQSMQWHRSRSQDPGLIWLRQLIHQSVARMDGDFGQRSGARSEPKSTRRQ